MGKQTVVAIPARDEARRIGCCLAALARQSILADHVVLLLNNCIDDTAAAVSSSPKAAHTLHIIECTLPESSASAGVARSLATNHAAALIEDGLILTTDADAEVPENWVEANLNAVDLGADAVCGMAVIDPLEALMIPKHLHEDDAREVAYGRLLDEIGSIILPDPADPWPHHSDDSGASIALTASIFRRMGGVPCVPAGEDRALIEVLRRMDARIRHDPAISVIVSGRIEGRARGGMADTIRRRIAQQDEFVDDRLEPALPAIRRVRLKQRFKGLWLEPDNLQSHLLAKLLGIDPRLLTDAIATPYFGLGWRLIEKESPILKRQRVRFRELPQETAIARRIHQNLTGAGAPAELSSAMLLTS